MMHVDTKRSNGLQLNAQLPCWSDSLAEFLVLIQ